MQLIECIQTVCNNSLLRSLLRTALRYLLTSRQITCSTGSCTYYVDVYLEETDVHMLFHNRKKCSNHLTVIISLSVLSGRPFFPATVLIQNILCHCPKLQLQLVAGYARNKISSIYSLYICRTNKQRRKTLVKI